MMEVIQHLPQERMQERFVEHVLFLVPQMNEEIAKVLCQRVEEQLEDLLVSEIKEINVSGLQLLLRSACKNESRKRWRLTLRLQL